MSYCDTCHIVDSGAKPGMQHRRCGGSAHTDRRRKHNALPSNARGVWQAGPRDAIKCETCNPPEPEEVQAAS